MGEDPIVSETRPGREENVKHPRAQRREQRSNDPQSAARDLLEKTGRSHMPAKPTVVHSDPEILGGTPVFVGTRVPVKSLYDYLEAGDSLDEFLDSFPSVTREQAVAALELAREALAPDAHPA